METSRREPRRLARLGIPATSTEAQRSAAQWSRRRRINPLAILAVLLGVAALALGVRYHSLLVVSLAGWPLTLFGAAYATGPASPAVHRVNLEALDRASAVREHLHLPARPRGRLPWSGPVYVAIALCLAAGAATGTAAAPAMLAIAAVLGLVWDRSGHRRPRLPVHLDDYGVHLPP